MKKQPILVLILVSLFFVFSHAQSTIDKAKLIGTWQQVDSLGNPVRVSPDVSEYKIITPETFTVVQSINSKGFFIGIFLGTYTLENDTYVENICYTNPAAIKAIGTKNLFYATLKNDLFYISGINNPYKQIWKKIDKLPAATLSSQSTDMSAYFSQKPDLSKVKFEGGDGMTIETAVVVKAPNERDGIAAEYLYIGNKYGARNVDWSVVSQSSSSKTNKKYDTICIKLTKGNRQITLYFDTTAFYGKM